MRLGRGRQRVCRETHGATGPSQTEFPGSIAARCPTAWRVAAPLLLALLLVIGASQADRARAAIAVHVQLSQQTMQVSVDGASFASWPVSTARQGYQTPTGTFRPTVLDRMHYSSRYENAPMPYSVFFYYGFAIHGTMDVRNLGRPVSHGCVRLSPRNAQTLFNLVRQHGAGNTTITID